MRGFFFEATPEATPTPPPPRRHTKIRPRAPGRVLGALSSSMELELELIQPHMAQKPVLRGEVGYACVTRESSVERRGMGDGTAVQRFGCLGGTVVVLFLRNFFSFPWPKTDSTQVMYLARPGGTTPRWRS